MDVAKMISEMTLEEKISLVSGHDFMYTNPVSRLQVPAIRMSDGPHGLRVLANEGLVGKGIATCFPTASLSGNTFNPALTYQMGKAIAEEARYYGIHIVLGPGVNIKRNPRCGRNFEYFSEDPYLSSEMAIGEVNGIQDGGVSSCIKHFALNNSENHRFNSNSIVDERTMREIYLKVFERIVKKASPDCVMTAYNQVNGTYCSENRLLLEDILRKEWGYDGLVMTDWGAINDRVKALEAGLDLEMPGDCSICRKWLYDAITNKEMDLSILDKAVSHVLHVIDKTGYERTSNPDFEEHRHLAKKISLEGSVLLKNEKHVLPLDEKDKYLVIGDLFANMRYQGTGSSMITPTHLSTIQEIFDKNHIDYEYAQGYLQNSEDKDESLLLDAVIKAKSATNVLLFVGLTDYSESEGADREDVRLPDNQLKLIRELVKVNKNIVVVLFGGDVIDLEFENDVNGILDMFLSGQECASSCFDLLFGRCNPSGRLSQTWMKKYEDVPYHDEFASSRDELYKEGPFVGYRYYETFHKEVRYPFGYGLSYSHFEYLDMSLVEDDGFIHVKVRVKNNSIVPGKEVIQVYTSIKQSSLIRPISELKAFKKVAFEAYEEKEVELIVSKDDLDVYDITQGKWVLEEGNYDIQIMKNSHDLILHEVIFLKGENIVSPYDEEVRESYLINPTKIDEHTFERLLGRKIHHQKETIPLTMESSFYELKDSHFWGKRIYSLVSLVCNHKKKKARKMKDPITRETNYKSALFLERVIMSNSFRSMTMSAGKYVSYYFTEGILLMANGHFFKGFGRMLKRTGAPKSSK